MLETISVIVLVTTFGTPRISAQAGLRSGFTNYLPMRLPVFYTKLGTSVITWTNRRCHRIAICLDGPGSG